jgi:hypothetical protein
MSNEVRSLLKAFQTTNQLDKVQLQSMVSKWGIGMIEFVLKTVDFDPLETCEMTLYTKIHQNHTEYSTQDYQIYSLLLATLLIEKKITKFKYFCSNFNMLKDVSRGLFKSLEYEYRLEDYCLSSYDILMEQAVKFIAVNSSYRDYFNNISETKGYRIIITEETIQTVIKVFKVIRHKLQCASNTQQLSIQEDVLSEMNFLGYKMVPERHLTPRWKDHFIYDNNYYPPITITKKVGYYEKLDSKQINQVKAEVQRSDLLRDWIMKLLTKPKYSIKPAFSDPTAYPFEGCLLNSAHSKGVFQLIGNSMVFEQPLSKDISFAIVPGRTMHDMGWGDHLGLAVYKELPNDLIKKLNLVPVDFSTLSDNTMVDKIYKSANIQEVADAVIGTTEEEILGIAVKKHSIKKKSSEGMGVGMMKVFDSALKDLIDSRNRLKEELRMMKKDPKLMEQMQSSLYLPAAWGRIVKEDNPYPRRRLLQDPYIISEINAISPKLDLQLTSGRCRISHITHETLKNWLNFVTQADIYKTNTKFNAMTNIIKAIIADCLIVEEGDLALEQNLNYVLSKAYTTWIAKPDKDILIPPKARGLSNY